MTSWQGSHLLAMAAELVTPKCPHSMLVASLGLTQALPHTLFSMAIASEARPRISVLYPHPGHGAKPCQESNTATLQFQLAL